MLQAISDRIRESRWLGYLIVAIISVPFALWGIQAYFTGGGPQEVAQVDGEPIASHLLDRQVSERRRELRERFGDELPDDFSDDALRRRVLDDLITQELVTQRATKLGLKSSDGRVADMIRGQEHFQRGAQFDAELYRQLLARSGIRPAEYEADMRRTDRVQQLQQGLAGSGFALPSEARHIATIEAQEREVSVVRIPAAAVQQEVSISDEEVRTFYEEHADRFETPRRLQVAYIELNLNDLAETIDVTDEEIEAEFERRVRRAEEGERRQAAHILIEVPVDASPEAEEEARERLADLRQQIEEGADFGVLASEHSDDLGSADRGGDLGLVERGDMVDRFDQALFELDEPGSLSEPVRTRFGYHLIRLEGIEGGKGPTLERLREEIRADLQRRQAQEAFFDRVDALVNAAYENPGSLEPAAEASGLEIEQSGWFSRESGDGIAAHAALRSASFADEVRVDGRNSDVIEIDDRHVAVVRMLDEKSSEPIPFAEVEEEVRGKLHAERVAEKRAQWMAALRRDFEEGVDLDAARERGDPPLRIEGPDVLRFDQEGGVFNEAVRSAAFALSVPDADGPPSVGEVTLEEGESALVLLHSVFYPEPAAEHLAEFEFLLQRLYANAELEAWVAMLRAGADIEINERRLRRGTGDVR